MLRSRNSNGWETLSRTAKISVERCSRVIPHSDRVGEKLGISDGSLDGFTVGGILAVGAFEVLEGISDGATLTLGASDPATVGLAEGITDGLMEMLGEPEGVMAGCIDTEGELDGTLEGLGETVGKFDREIVGPMVCGVVGWIDTEGDLDDT